MGRVFFLLLALAGLLAFRADAASARRVALVIGNAAYEEAGDLANPVNDATDIAAKLRSIGFEVVEGHDLGKRALERKIGEFADALDGAATGLFFYAGHGIQIDGRNFVLPTDARIDVPVKLKLEAVPMDEILDIMEQQVSVSLVFLDACRNDPFVGKAKNKAADRSARALTGGLSQFDTSRGSFIAFSTNPGAVALDGAGRNSPFAAALLAHVATPGQSINDMMLAVRRDVLAATRQQQRPWEQGSLTERFEFVPADVKPGEPASAPPSVEAASLQRSVADSGSIEKFVVDHYLATDGLSLREDVRRIYADSPSVFGVTLGFDALVKAKADWFAQFASWTLTLEPGSLATTQQGADRAEADFTMTYDYVPRDSALPRQQGRARVKLGLVIADGEWKVKSESSEIAR